MLVLNNLSIFFSIFSILLCFWNQENREISTVCLILAAILFKETNNKIFTFIPFEEGQI